jgi:DNA-binding Xre family transcriptional regulator
MSTDDLMSLEEIQALLKDKKLYVIAEATGLTYPTLKKLADGKKANYTYGTLLKVTNYLRPTKTTAN